MAGKKKLHGPQKDSTVQQRRGTRASGLIQRCSFYAVERLESRRLLSSVLASGLPSSILPTLATQIALPPGTSTFGTSTLDGLKVVNAQYYQFSVVSDGSESTQFSTHPAAATTDTALALYDKDGNLLQRVDADAPSGIETLQANLQSATPYILGVASANLGPSTAAAPLNVAIDTGSQRLNSTIHVNPATGAASFIADTGTDRFTSPADTNYFPLDFTNVSQTATLQVQASATSRIFASLFRRPDDKSPWESIASNTGFSASINALPNLDLTDSQFLLAVSPQGLASSALPYTITASAPALVGPAVVSPASAVPLPPLAITKPLICALTSSGTLSGSAQLLSIQASADGDLALSLTSAFKPALSVYNADGSQLLNVTTSTVAGQITAHVPALAGQRFILRIADDTEANSGSYSLTASQTYSPTELNANSTLTQTSGLLLDPAAGGAFFRLTPAPASDFMSIELRPDVGATSSGLLQLFSPSLGLITLTQVPGETIDYSIDLTKSGGPVEVYVSGSGGAGTATLLCRTLTVPRSIALGAMPTQVVDLTNGSMATTTSPLVFGQMGGAQFSEIGPGAEQTLTATSSAQSPILRYVLQGSQVVLDDLSLASATGGTAKLTSRLKGGQLYALASMGLNISGNTPVSLNLAGPAPSGVGVQMVPDPVPPQTPTQAKLQIRNVVLKNSYQRDLWQTSLPTNGTATPVVIFAPVNSGQPLTVKLSVLDANNAVLASGTSAPGASLTLGLTNVTNALYGGKTLRFLVEPVAGSSLGDGMYNLTMTEATGDPSPYLVTEPNFNAPRTNPQQGDFPANLTSNYVVFGNSASGEFTSSSPYWLPSSTGNTGSIALYYFKLPIDLSNHLVPQPFQVYTTDTDASVNTNIGLYYAHYPSGSLVPDRFDRLPNTAPSFDCYPGDRSKVDAKIVVNNYHILDGIFTGNYANGAGNIWVVVKNEGGSLGKYTLHVEPILPVKVGPGAPDPQLHLAIPPINSFIDPITGLDYVTSPSTLGAIEVSCPSDLSGQPSVTITSTLPAGVTSDTVSIDVYNGLNTFLYHVQTSTTGNATLTLHDISPSSAYYLHVSTNKGSLLNGAQITAPVSPSPIRPAETDQIVSTPDSPAEKFNRIVPAPDGSYSEADNGLFSTKTQNKSIFYVEASGLATFSVTTTGMTNSTWALYKTHVGVFGGEFPDYSSNLVDFVSMSSSGTYSFSDFLTPGSYCLKFVGTGPTFKPPFSIGGSVAFNLSLPAFDASDIQLDPASANNDTLPLRTVVQEETFDHFAASYYHVTAPGGVQSPLSIDLNQLDVSPDDLGKVSLTAFKKVMTGSTVSYQQVGNTVLNGSTSSVTLTTSDMTSPGDEYFIAVSRSVPAITQTNNFFFPRLLLGPSFTVPQSGSPDLTVSSIQLTPNGGKTLVTVTLENRSFVTAPASHSLFQLSNYAQSSLLNLAAVGPMGSIVYTADWNPDAPSNSATYQVNYDRTITEADLTNDSRSVLLASVDGAIPTASIALADSTLNGESKPGLWGRYISGVSLPAEVDVTANDTDGNLYAVYFGDTYFTTVTPSFKAPAGASVSHQVLAVNGNFGRLSPTSATQPNLLSYYAVDQFGLRTAVQTQQVDVVARPNIIDYAEWDSSKKQYRLLISKQVVNFNKSINEITNSHIDFVGDLRNQFLIELDADVAAGLNPSSPITAPLKVSLLTKVLGQDVIKDSWSGKQTIARNALFSSELMLDGQSLKATVAQASFSYSNNIVSLHDDRTLLSLHWYVFGLDIQSHLKFDVDLKAGLKLGLATQASSDTSAIAGFMSPTFVEATANGSASLGGSFSVLGINAVDLSGTLKTGLDLVVGLDNSDPAQVFSLDDLVHHLALKLIFTAGYSAELKLLSFIPIWSKHDSWSYPLIDTSSHGILTSDPTDKGDSSAANASAIPAAAPPQPQDGSPPPGYAGGNTVIGDHVISSVPQLVIDSTTGNALSVQVMNGGTAAAPVGSLQVSQRNGGVWSAPVVLPASDALEPILALSHDVSGKTPGVLVYDGMSGTDPTSALTINQRLTRNDIRFRYFDGTNWSAEQAVTPVDGLFDFSPSVAFNASGIGVAAWVHNSNPAPMADNGAFSSATQDIQAAIWNPATHTFGTPLTIGSPDGVSDYSPSTFVDSNGQAYVVWLHGTSKSNQLYFSTNTGSGWSAPAPLPISGLPSGGSFGEVAIGSESGRVHVVFSYSTANADGSVESHLYDRGTAPADFAGASGYQTLSADPVNASHLRLTNLPNGINTLVAYWVQSDGANSGVFASILARTPPHPNAPWTTPLKLTSTTDLTQDPSLAAEQNGTFRLLYRDVVPLGATASTTPPDPSVGVSLVSGVGSTSFTNLPELSFSKGLTFAPQEGAAIGAPATGSATIVNSGQAKADITVSWYQGLPQTGNLLGIQQIQLSPGASYDFAQDFPVLAGNNTYSVQVTSAQGEAISTADDVSSTALIGAPDLTVGAVTSSTSTPTPGASIVLSADVSNLSASAVGPFDVTLYRGDPKFPQTAPVAIQTLHVTSLAALASVNESFPLMLPTAAGDYVYTIKVDAAKAIAEAIEANNESQYRVSFHTDPAVVPNPVSGVGQVTATLLNASGVNNVKVDAVIGNYGNVNLANLKVGLQTSRNGGAFVDAASQIITSLSPGQTLPVSFTAAGLDGTTIYRVLIDPSAESDDINLNNNSGQATLTVHELADLAVDTVAISDPNPFQTEAVNVSTTISNHGGGDAEGVLVEVLAIGNGTQIVVGSTTVDLAALQSVNLSIPIDTKQLLGTYTLQVQVNRLQSILESNETNNAAAISVVFGPKVLRVASSQVGDGGAQRSTVSSFAVKFTAPVALTSSSFTLLRSNNGSPLFDVSAGVLASNPSGDGVTWIFTVKAGGPLDRTGATTHKGLFIDGTYQLVLHGAAISSGGLLLNGGEDYTVPFDFMAGTGTRNDFHVLYGDIDGNGIVNNIDYGRFRNAFNTSSGSAAFVAAFDFDGGGVINNADFGVFRNRFNSSIL